MGRRAMHRLAGFEWATSPQRTLSEESTNACEVFAVIDAERPCKQNLRSLAKSALTDVHTAGALT